MKKSKAVIPILMFFLLYIMLHCSTINSINKYSLFEMIVKSLIFGTLLGAIRSCVSMRSAAWHFRYEILVFLGTYAIVQITSVFLLWGYIYYDISQNTIWYKLLYLFPQLLLVAYTVPGIIAYHLIGYISYLWQRSK